MYRIRKFIMHIDINNDVIQVNYICYKIYHNHNVVVIHDYSSGDHLNVGHNEVTRHTNRDFYKRYEIKGDKLLIICSTTNRFIISEDGILINFDNGIKVISMEGKVLTF